MTDDTENPYQSPSVIEGDAVPELSADLRHGRRIFLAITAGSATVQALVLWMDTSQVMLVQATLTAGLFFAMWFGQQWAIAIGALCFVLAALSAIVAGVATGTLLGFSICLIIAFLFGGTFWLFVASESLNAFFRYQLTVGRPGEEELAGEAETPPEVDPAESP